MCAPTCSVLLQLALSRTREYNADLGAVELTGDPISLATALKKINHNPVRLFDLLPIPKRRESLPSMLRTHPVTQKRIDRLLQLAESYTPKEIAELLDQVGGADKFNTGEVEKSIVNMFGHLQGHIQRGVNELENLTNALLRQKTDVGAFIRGENAYSVVKCSFKDNIYKPKTVTDVKLSVNILDSELISPIFHYQVTVEYLIKDLIAKHIIDMIDKEIEKLKDQLIDEGREELNDTEIIFEKMKKVKDFTDDDVENPKSKRYTIIAKELMDRINNLRAEIDPATFDQLNIRENLKKIIDIENIRNRGYNTAVNSLTSILDTSKMGYQYIENLKNARLLIIREYEDTDRAVLPDERYQIRMQYYDNSQLNEERKAYDKQIYSFQNEVEHIWDVLEAMYDKSKFLKRITDFNDLAKIMKRRIHKKKEKEGNPTYESMAKVWDEISFIPPAETDVESLNRTYLYEKDKIKNRLILMREKLKTMYSYQYPIQRRVIEERLAFLEKEFNKFDYMINPYHIQPGLLLDVDITSIKRKKATLDGMANVLNEFLHGVSKGFQDAAFASFSRRRSTVREDINQSFAATTTDDAFADSKANYLSMINSSDSVLADITSNPAPAPKAKPKTGVVDTGVKKGTAKKSKPAGKAKSRGGLRELD
ncbi:TPA: cytochrome C oxidase subunit II [bacterium]|nr:cytochrome C oxidase subunit II [bacterium]